MRYPIAIEPGTETTAWGVTVPDLPGCFSAGETCKEAVANASDAIAAWIDAVNEGGGVVPPPGLIDDDRKRQFSGWTWTFAEARPPTITSPSAG